MSDEKDVPSGLPSDPHRIGLAGTLVLAGHRVGVQVGAHEVLYLDALLAGLAGKEIVLHVQEKLTEQEITFQVASKETGTLEMMRFSPSGKIFIRGEEVDDNKKVYEALRDWMAKVGILPK